MSKLPRQSNKPYFTEVDIYATYPDKEVSSLEFKLVLKTFFHLLSKSMVDEGKVYYLPPKLGTLGIYKIPSTKPMWDFDLYKKTGIKAKIKNRHTHGSMVKFHWNRLRPWYMVSNYGSPICFTFKASRYVARYLAKQLKENNTLHKYYDY